MRLRTATPSGSGVGWLLAAAVLIVGLIAMHAMATAAAACPQEQSADHHATSPLLAQPQQAGHSTGAVPGHPAAMTAGAGQSAGHCADGSHSGAMCLAILMGLAFLLLFRQRRRFFPSQSSRTGAVRTLPDRIAVLPGPLILRLGVLRL